MWSPRAETESCAPGRDSWRSFSHGQRHDGQHGLRLGVEDGLALAVQAIQTGNAEIVIAGGMESMTNAPYLLPQAAAASAWAMRPWLTR